MNINKIGSRLPIGFSFILSLFILVCIFIVIQMNSLSNLTTLMYNHPLTVSNAVLRIQGNIIKIHRSMKDVVLAQQQQELDKAVQLVNIYEKQIYADFNIITDRFLGDPDMYQEAQKVFTEWKPIRDMVIQLMEQGERLKAANITKGEGAQHVEKINQAMLSLNNFAQNKAISFHNASLKTRSQAITFTYILAFTALFIGTVFIVFLTKSITRPLKELIIAVSEISSGNFEKKINIHSNDELGELANAFNIMSEKLQASYKNLEDKVAHRTKQLKQTNTDLKIEIQKHQLSEENLKLHAQALDNMLEGVQIFKMDTGVTIYTNKAFQDMFGYNKSNLDGKHASLIIAHTDKSPEETFAEIIFTLEKEKEWEGELANIKTGGIEFWTQAKMSLFDHSVMGKICISVLDDISERKKAEAQIKAALKEKDTLLRELYHRTKNNMQVIRSILSLQRAYSKNKHVDAIFQETENKIQAMALVHQKLYQSKDLSKINMAEYFKELVELVISTFHQPTLKINTTFEMKDIHVLIDIAIPCGLILNELLSNSLKHAFKNRSEGNVHIKLDKDTNDDIIIIYSDDGIGVPSDFDFSNQKTLGLQTIQTIAEHQLQGTINFHANKGIYCQIIFNDLLYVPRV